MPQTVQLSMLPAGYILVPSFGGEDVPVEVTGFLTSEDGNDFIRRLDGISNTFGPAFDAKGVQPSQIDNLLAVISPDRTATVYINELRVIATTSRRVTHPKPLQAGDPLTVNDVADIRKVDLQNTAGYTIAVPPDHGVALILSRNWRKGVYFDYSVFPPRSEPRTADLPALFGHLMARLIFQERFSFSDGQWRRLFTLGWFPFTGLSREDHRTLSVLSLLDVDPRPHLEGVCNNFARDLAGRLEVWWQLPLIAEHRGFITTAFERYGARDYTSCLSVLIPRIEGVMRALFVRRAPGVRVAQGPLVSNLVANRDVRSVLLPNRFEAYLREVYFRNFDQETGDVSLSRHSHGHGASVESDYDYIRSTAAFLTLDQIYYYLTD
jgi:hypothetical protein